MNSFLICLLVIFLFQVLECVKNGVLRDLSDDCLNGRNLSQYLTHGIGVTDAYAVMIANPKPVKCLLNFTASKGKLIVVVIEFLDWDGGSHPCRNESNNLSIVMRDRKKIDVCSILSGKQTHIFRTLADNEVFVDVSGIDGLDSLKITATSVRDSIYKTCETTEMICKFHGREFCMTNEVLCDGNFNCGEAELYDEDKRRCSGGFHINAAIIIIGLLTSCTTLLMLVAFLRQILPRKKGTFIFKEDETLTEKDRAVSQKHFQIKLRVLYDSNEQPTISAIALPEHHKQIGTKLSYMKIKRS